MGEDRDDAGESGGLTLVDARNPTPRYGAGHDRRVRHGWQQGVGGVLGGPGDFELPMTRDGRPDGDGVERFNARRRAVRDRLHHGPRGALDEAGHEFSLWSGPVPSHGRQRALQGAAGECHLEGILGERYGSLDCRRRCLGKQLRRWRVPDQHAFCSRGAPWRRGHAAERHVGRTDDPVNELDRHGRRGQRELVTLPVAYLEVVRSRARGERWQRHGRDQLSRHDRGLPLRSVAGKKEKSLAANRRSPASPVR